MTPEQFVYWLQGFAEVNQTAPNDAQWTIIKDHLQLVFKKETPLRVGPGIAAPAYPNWPPYNVPGIPPTITCSVNGTTSIGFTSIPKGELKLY